MQIKLILPKMTLRILISASFMILVLDWFRQLFDSTGIALLVPQAVERLSEERRMAFTGDIDDVICGDDHFTSRVLEVSVSSLR